MDAILQFIGGIIGMALWWAPITIITIWIGAAILDTLIQQVTSGDHKLDVLYKFQQGLKTFFNKYAEVITPLSILGGFYSIVSLIVHTISTCMWLNGEPNYADGMLFGLEMWWVIYPALFIASYMALVKVGKTIYQLHLAAKTLKKDFEQHKSDNNAHN